jgi:FKBP-type peptidyl-prolyl cis-trans isomerase SlyD
VSQALVIAPDVHVTIRYSIFEEGSETVTDGAEGLTDAYVHGYGQVLPALERGLEGREGGDHVSVHAEPDDAYGTHEPDGVFEVDKEGLEGAEDLQPGEEVMASGPDGDILMRVLEVKAQTLLVDTNHPLAGKKLRFEVDVVEIREATEEEIAEAQAELDSGACGCGEAHAPEDHPGGDGDDHRGGDVAGGDLAGGVVAEQLVQLAAKRKN